MSLVALASLSLAAVSDEQEPNISVLLAPFEQVSRRAFRLEEHHEEQRIVALLSLSTAVEFTWQVTAYHDDPEHGEVLLMSIWSHYTDLGPRQAKDEAMQIVEMLRNFEARWAKHSSEHSFLSMLGEAPLNWISEWSLSTGERLVAQLHPPVQEQEGSNFSIRDPRGVPHASGYGHTDEYARQLAELLAYDLMKATL